MLNVLLVVTRPTNVTPLMVSVTVSPVFTSPLTVPVMATVPRASAALRILSEVTALTVMNAVISCGVALDVDVRSSCVSAELDVLSMLSGDTPS